MLRLRARLPHYRVGELRLLRRAWPEVRINREPWAEIETWLAAQHPLVGVLERIDRMRRADHEQRADRVHKVVPRRNYEAMGITGAPQTVYRGVPAAYEVLPGDWIALTATYASGHGSRSLATQVKSLPLVHPEDFFWAGWDQSEFLYQPAAWRREDVTREEYVRSLTVDQLRMFCDGEMASLTRHAQAIRAIENHVHQAFDVEACGLYHGRPVSRSTPWPSLGPSESIPWCRTSSAWCTTAGGWTRAWIPSTGLVRPRSYANIGRICSASFPTLRSMRWRWPVTCTATVRRRASPGGAHAGMPIGSISAA
jgi:hypothetical protein